MTDRPRDLAHIDHRGAHAAIDVRQAAGEVDTAVMYERVRAPRHRWLGPAVALAGTVVAVAIGVLVGLRPALPVDSVPSMTGHQKPVGGTGDEWWCPPEAAAVVRQTTDGEPKLVGARLSTAGQVTDWQDHPFGGVDERTVPDLDGRAPTWLEELDRDTPSAVCTFSVGGAGLDFAGGSHVTVVAPARGVARIVSESEGTPRPRDFGPDGSTELRAAPPDWGTTIEVPDVVGMTEQEAIRVLSHAGLDVLTSTKATDDPAMVGVVLGQSPRPGEVSASSPPSGTTGNFSVVIQVAVDVDT